MEQNRLWRWEEGGGAFTIGKSLYMEHAGCQRRGGVGCQGQADEAVGVRGLALLAPGRGGKPDEPALVLCEGGDRRVTRIEANGSKTPLLDVAGLSASPWCTPSRTQRFIL